MRKIMVVLLTIPAAVAVAGDWTENVEIGGNLRYRHELIDEDGSEIRNRQRLRARLTLDAALEPSLGLHVRLATGSENPRSTNQTLDGAFSSKGFMLDRAYFAWRHDCGLALHGGKMSNPFRKPAKTELIWDGDLSPEGLAVFYATDGATSLFLGGAGLWIDERTGEENTALIGGQAGITHAGDGFRVTVGGGYYDYTDLAGPLYGDDFFGNSNDGDDFLSDFNLVEAFMELGLEVGGMPVDVFADFVVNSEADEDDQGYLVGFRLNRARKPGDWTFVYSYREVQADAVMGAMTDSDFAGGDTDGKGHELGGAYQVSAASQLALTWFVNTLGIDDGSDYQRVQADLKFRF